MKMRAIVLTALFHNGGIQTLKNIARPLALAAGRRTTWAGAGIDPASIARQAVDRCAALRKAGLLE
jgi:hypothetical protein